MSSRKELIEKGKTVLGIEFGSTRIKAVLIDENHHSIASGDHEWENRLENGIWTYSLDDIWQGLRDSYQKLAFNVEESYGVTLKKIGAIGFSAMMHGYMAFDKNGELLVPFRTWRNGITGEASEALTEAFQYNIPQRWSIAHLYQAILNEGEDENTDPKFYGKIYASLGSAYGRMFLYQQAARMYDRAYQICEDPKLLKPYLYASYKYMSMEEYHILLTKNDTYAEINTELRSEMKEIREGIQMEMSEQLTDKWKQQYRRSHI